MASPQRSPGERSPASLKDCRSPHLTVEALRGQLNELQTDKRRSDAAQSAELARERDRTREMKTRVEDEKKARRESQNRLNTLVAQRQADREEIRALKAELASMKANEVERDRELASIKASELETARRIRSLEEAVGEPGAQGPQRQAESAKAAVSTQHNHPAQAEMAPPKRSPSDVAKPSARAATAAAPAAATASSPGRATTDASWKSKQPVRSSAGPPGATSSPAPRSLPCRSPVAKAESKASGERETPQRGCVSRLVAEFQNRTGTTPVLSSDARGGGAGKATVPMKVSASLPTLAPLGPRTPQEMADPRTELSGSSNDSQIELGLSPIRTPR